MRVSLVSIVAALACLSLVGCADVKYDKKQDGKRISFIQKREETARKLLSRLNFRNDAQPQLFELSSFGERKKIFTIQLQRYFAKYRNKVLAFIVFLDDIEESNGNVVTCFSMNSSGDLLNEDQLCLELITKPFQADKLIKLSPALPNFKIPGFDKEFLVLAKINKIYKGRAAYQTVDDPQVTDSALVTSLPNMLFAQGELIDFVEMPKY